MIRSGLRYLAGALALAVAGIHLYWGFPRLITQLDVGAVPDPRPIAFVLSSVAIILGIAQILDGRNPKPIYLAGIALMFAYIGGYVAWHTVLGHGGFWPWMPELEQHTHDEGLIDLVIGHLAEDPLALASKLLELSLAIVLGVLYRGEKTAGDDAVQAAVGSQ